MQISRPAAVTGEAQGSRCPSTAGSVGGDLLPEHALLSQEAGKLTGSGYKSLAFADAKEKSFIWNFLDAWLVQPLKISSLLLLLCDQSSADVNLYRIG